MRAHVLVGMTFLISAASTGCSELRGPLSLSDPPSVKIRTTYAYVIPEGGPTPPNYFQTKFDDAKNDTAKKAVRNRIVYELMRLVDDDYGKFEGDLRGDRAYKDTIVKIVSLVLTGGASLAQKTAANTLSALDTGLKGANEAIDANAFRSYTPELLINRMRTNRAEVAAKIYKSMDQPVDKYPLEAAIRDIVNYYKQGSVTSALASLAATTSKEADTAMESADKAKLNAYGVKWDGATTTQ